MTQIIIFIFSTISQFSHCLRKQKRCRNTNNKAIQISKIDPKFLPQAIKETKYISVHSKPCNSFPGYKDTWEAKISFYEICWNFRSLIATGFDATHIVGKFVIHRVFLTSSVAMALPVMPTSKEFGVSYT